jgi:DNA-binding response OmpR family regulator
MKQHKSSFEEVSIVSLPTKVFVNASIMPRPEPLRTALVVDDDHKIADTLVQILEANGFLAEAAYSGEEGLARARELRPGIIISDVGLPKMDGLTMVDTICGFLPKAKIVLICEQLPAKMEIPAWSVLKKPVRATDLLSVLSLPADKDN